MSKSAEKSADSLDFSARLQFYKFEVDEYDKSQRLVNGALALLYAWVHISLRPQLQNFVDPKQAYDWVVQRYSVSNTRALEIASNVFEGARITEFRTAQDYVNALETARADMLEAGGYCDEKMVLNKLIRGLSGAYAPFITQYHMLRDIDERIEELDHVITTLLTYESTMRGRRP